VIDELRGSGGSEGGGEGGEGGEGGGGSDAAANARACRRPSDFVAANRASRQPGGLEKAGEG